MDLDFLILADKAEALNGKMYLMGGGFSNVFMTQIPGPAVIDLAIGLMFDYHETGEQHEMSVALEDADNHPLATMNVPLPVGRPPGLPPGDTLRMVMAVRGPFQIEVDGLYHFVVAVDGTRFRPTRFRVQRVVPLVPLSTPDAPTPS